MRIGIAGLGTVGASLVRIIQETLSDQITIAAVSARSREKDRGVDLSDYFWVDSPVALLDHELDCVIELIGGADGEAFDLVYAALDQGIHVITANKAMMAAHGKALAALAEQRDVALAYEAAVAGSIPIISTLQDLVQGDECQAIYGILNGTCNFILSKMEKTSAQYTDVLTEAQALGYAEVDPVFDVGGFDSGHKLTLLASLGFGIEVSDFPISGIDVVTLAQIDAAKELGYRLMLLGYASKQRQGVQVMAVPMAHPLASVRGVMNAVHVDMKYAGSQTLVGAGAGGGPTASSVIADLLRLYHGIRKPVFGRSVSALIPHGSAPQTRSFDMIEFAGQSYPVLSA